MLTVPDLPAYDPATEMTLREAINAGLVTGRGTHRPAAQMVQRWATRGCRIIPGWPKIIFPSTKGPRERLTCRPWCEAFSRFVANLRRDHAHRQQQVIEAIRAGAYKEAVG